MELLIKDIPTSIINSTTQTFWQCFDHALKDNKKNRDGKRRVLSIIADDFTYKELQEKLNVSISIRRHKLVFMFYISKIGLA